MVWLGFFRFWLGFFRFGSVFSVWLGFSGLARFWLGFLSVSVRFGFFGFLFIKPKPNRTGRFFQKFNRFNRFFFRFGFFGYFFSGFLGLISFPVFLLTPTIYDCPSTKYILISIFYTHPIKYKTYLIDIIFIWKYIKIIYF